MSDTEFLLSARNTPFGSQPGRAFGSPFPRRPAITLAIIATLAALGLSGCQTTRRPPTPEQRARTGAAMAARPVDTEMMKSLGNTTSVTFSAHGPQVSYKAADGRVFLWYPGNDKVLAGEWKGVKPYTTCYRYGPESYNPATGVPGGNWECTTILSSIYGTRGHERRGDVFGLAHRAAVPFVTKRDRAQFDALVAKLPPPTAEDKTSRILAHYERDKAEKTRIYEEELWKQVGQPPAGQDAGAEPATPEQ